MAVGLAVALGAAGTTSRPLAVSTRCTLSRPACMSVAVAASFAAMTVGGGAFGAATLATCVAILITPVGARARAAMAFRRATAAAMPLTAGAGGLVADRHVFVERRRPAADDGDTAVAAILRACAATVAATRDRAIAIARPVTAPIFGVAMAVATVVAASAGTSYRTLAVAPMVGTVARRAVSPVAAAGATAFARATVGVGAARAHRVRSQRRVVAAILARDRLPRQPLDVAQ